MVIQIAAAHAVRTFLFVCLLAATAGCGQVAVTENDAQPGGASAESLNPQQRDSVTLSWLPPTEYSDGSPLQDLAAYKIYSGPTRDDLEPRETVDNPGLSSYVIDSLEPHELYFAITAMNSRGAESMLSEVVQAPQG